MSELNFRFVYSAFQTAISQPVRESESEQPKRSLTVFLMCVDKRDRNLMCAYASVCVAEVVIRYLMNISLFRLTRSLIKI